MPVLLGIRSEWAVGSGLVRGKYSGLDVEAVPRHSVIIVGPGDLGALRALLVELERGGIEVEQVTR